MGWYLQLPVRAKAPLTHAQEDGAPLKKKKTCHHSKKKQNIIFEIYQVEEKNVKPIVLVKKITLYQNHLQLHSEKSRF